MARPVQLTSKEKATLHIKKARNGKGIFAKVEFLPGATIYEVTGPFITCDVDEEIDEVVRDNAIRFSSKWYVSPEGKVGAIQNHSCNPNAKVMKKDKRLFVVALSHISRGEEVVIDYSTIVARDDIWEMQCNCGEKNCRKVIGPFHKLPKKLKDAYVSLKAVPPYVYRKPIKG